MRRHTAGLGRRRTAMVLGIGILTAAGLGASALGAPGGARGDDTPVTVCHKPGTAAEHELTFDNNALQAHLRHGDTLGACGQAAPAAAVTAAATTTG